MHSQKIFAGRPGAAMLGSIALFGMLVALPAQSAIPGITGVSATPTFNLAASADFTSQPDGAQLYSFGYGCTASPTGYTQTWGKSCGLMQMPGPTLVVTEGDAVTVVLTNLLPAAAGNTSIVFPGFAVKASGGSAGLLAQEAPSSSCQPLVNAGCNLVTYTFTATNPGTYAYYSGSQSDLQIEMGLFGALIVLPNAASLATAGCPAKPLFADTARLAPAAYRMNGSCYDREFLFQFSEHNSVVHQQVLDQVTACPVGPCAALKASIEPYHPNYFLINGRSMPDLMDASFAPGYPRQPYNGNPQMHPGERMLMRIIGQSRWQHPFHYHGNHARVLARDGYPLLSASDPSKLAGPLLFTTSTVPGQTQDQIFTWTGQGLNWDVYGSDPLTQGHSCNSLALPTTVGDPTAQSPGFDPLTHEYCPDHGKPIPVTPPDPQIVANGQWYGGTPYLGLQGFHRSDLPPGTLNQNPAAGYAYMWHSHNEREITTNDVFPGGMMMMMIVNPSAWTIDESQ